MIARKSLSVLASAALAASLCAAAPATAALANGTAAANAATTAAAAPAATGAAAATAAKSYSLSALQQKRVAVLADNLVTRFAAGGANASLDNNTMDAALALQQLAAASSGALKASNLIDGAALLKALKADDAANDGSHCGRLAKYLVGLNAAGVKQNKYASYLSAFSGQVASALAAPTGANAYDTRAYNVVWILPALVTYCPNNTELIEQAVAILADKQAENGVIAGDNQTTAQAVWALSQVPASTGDAVTPAQDTAAKALAALQNAQLSSGAWPYSASYATPNLDTTGWAMFVLASAASSAAAAGDSSTAASYANACIGGASYLQSVADENLTYFSLTALSNETMASAAALLGFASSANAGAITLDSGTLGAGVGAYLAPNKVTSVAVKSKKACQLTVSWANANGKKLAVDGYQVRVLSGGKLIKSASFKVKKTEAKKKVDGVKRKYIKLTVPKSGTITVDPKYSGKKLSVYVRAYRVKNAHRGAVYSTASATVKVKVK